jgi:serine protease
LSNSNQYRSYNVGTSFSAPLVSGITALMSSVNSNLNSCQLISRLKQTAQAFPQTSSTSTTTCHVPANANDVQNAECICTNDGQTCGAGMANAAAALAAALHPVAAVSLPSSVSSGQTVDLDGSGSKAANSASISSYAWTNLSGAVLSIQNASSAKTSVTAPSCRISTLRLTVTDNAGLSDTADVVITPTSASSSAPATASGSSSCTMTPPPAEEIQVCPVNASVVAGGAGQAFTADVVNASNSAVSWEVNGVAGGDSTVGTVSSSGAYTPPSTVPSPSTVTLTAVSALNSAVSSSSQVTVTAPAPPPSSHSGGGALDWLSLTALSLFSGVRIRQRRHGKLSVVNL